MSEETMFDALSELPEEEKNDARAHRLYRR